MRTQREIVIERILKDYIVNRGIISRLTNSQNAETILDYPTGIEEITFSAQWHASRYGIEPKNKEEYDVDVAKIQKELQGLGARDREFTSICEEIFALTIKSANPETAENIYEQIIVAYDRLHSLQYENLQLFYSVNLPELQDRMQTLLKNAKRKSKRHPEAEMVVGTLEGKLVVSKYFDKDPLPRTYNIMLPSDLSALDRMRYLPDSVYSKFLAENRVAGQVSKPLAVARYATKPAIEMPQKRSKQPKRKPDEELLRKTIRKHTNLDEDGVDGCYRLLENLKGSLTREQLSEFIDAIDPEPKKDYSEFMSVVGSVLRAYDSVSNGKKSFDELMELIRFFRHDKLEGKPIGDCHYLKQKLEPRLRNHGTTMNGLI